MIGSTIFSINADELSQDVDRLYLKFIPQSLNESLEMSLEQNCETEATLDLILESSQVNANYEVYVNDQLDTVLTGSGNHILLRVNNNLQSGENRILVKAISQGCIDETLSFEKSIRVIQKPEIEYDQSDNILHSISGQKGHWYVNGELVSSVQSSYIEPDPIMGGVYFLEVTNESCALRSEEFLVTSTDEVLIGDKLEVSPVPANAYINIKFEGDFDKIILTDITGKLYYSSNSSLTTIDVSSYENGVYIVTVISGDNNYSRRFIKN